MQGSAVSGRDEDGWTALETAAGSGDTEQVRRLLAAGADPGERTPDGRTAYEVALAAGRLPAAALLREALPSAAESYAWRPYCRAYRLGELRTFGAWTQGADAPESDDTVAYLHDDLSVTRAAWPGEEIIFDGGAPGWTEFCAEVLGFAVPDDFDLVPPTAGEPGATP